MPRLLTTDPEGGVDDRRPEPNPELGCDRGSHRPPIDAGREPNALREPDQGGAGACPIETPAVPEEGHLVVGRIRVRRPREGPRGPESRRYRATDPRRCTAARRWRSGRHAWRTCLGSRSGRALRPPFCAGRSLPRRLRRHGARGSLGRPGRACCRARHFFGCERRPVTRRDEGEPEDHQEEHEARGERPEDPGAGYSTPLVPRPRFDSDRSRPRVLWQRGACGRGELGIDEDELGADRAGDVLFGFHFSSVRKPKG
jgi:hypothetical protein